MTDGKPMTTDRIDVLMVEGAKENYDTVVDKITQLYNHNMHKAYEKFKVSMVKDAKLGWALIFEGEREENKTETAEREAKEFATRKRLEDAELKEYLKLHKKYGKKCDDGCKCS